MPVSLFLVLLASFLGVSDARDCFECDGKMTMLALQYNGPDGVQVRVVQKKGAEVYDGELDNGAIFTFYGADDKGTLGTEISIYINGDLGVKVHTSCSVELYRGETISQHFTIVDGESKNGGRICLMPGAAEEQTGGPIDCLECDGKMTMLELQYNGPDDAQVRVVQKNGTEVYDGGLDNGDIFIFYGTDDKGTLGTEISIYINDYLDAEVHTSCSVELYRGETISGHFTIVDGESRNGGRICLMPGATEEPTDDPVDGPTSANNPTPTPTIRPTMVPTAEQTAESPTACPDCDCLECDGKMTMLELQYNGSDDAQVQVAQKKGPEVYDGELDNGDVFTFYGADKKDTLGTEISIFINGYLDVKVHTSCSVELYRGQTISEHFTIVDGESRNGGRICLMPGAT